MGSRMTQIVGLTEDARKFINENVRKVPMTVCDKCGHVVTERLDFRPWKDESESGMFGDGPKLYEYTLKDGTTVREIIQAIPWSSGPVIFMCLEKDGKQLFEWSEQDIQNA